MNAVERSEGFGRHIPQVVGHSRGRVGPQQGPELQEQKAWEKQTQFLGEQVWRRPGLISAAHLSRDAPERLSKCAGGPRFRLNFLFPPSYTMKCEF